MGTQVQGSEAETLRLWWEWLAQCCQAHFLLQPKAECHFYNGTEQVRYLERYFYNRQEYVHFDSDLGEYRALTELGWPDEKDWNSQEDLMEQKRAALNKFCRHNYWVSEGFSVQRKRTFQTLVMLETVPRSGEVYTCQVRHPSSTSPVTMEWRAQSGSAQSKVLSGAGGFLLGLLFLGAGLLIYFRAQKGHSALQPTGNPLESLFGGSSRGEPPRALAEFWLLSCSSSSLLVPPALDLEAPVLTADP
ncbi:PREDICTED: HLA class II histocompatibility antigen, DRB1-16 beta chain [Myotis davidii]|uniref:HLA class II histocompatibility antigen, DRB1-16 beta chain n=1 Tax=Myotis davidii TaxID=225400 RepID=UPI000767C1C7|nr:PREDICTED: HLA class II histocompatibility antigen, DRB1-16 beta chain [Myotis davidii]